MEDAPKKESIIQFPDIAREIMVMVKADQDMRERNILQDEHWDASVDKNNTVRMKQIVEEIGWPTVSKVGVEASYSAWLLVQHADHDVDFQKHALSLMQEQPSGEIDTKDLALLTDRVRINSGQPQLYGTQFTQIDGKHVPKEIEDIANVDARRKLIGLDTLAENIESMNVKYPFKKF